jgi:hypothetical protein
LQYRHTPAVYIEHFEDYARSVLRGHGSRFCPRVQAPPVNGSIDLNR